jgi:hypothetical protein
MRTTSIAAISALCLVLANHARADDRPEADALFARGIELASTEPARACEAFEASYKLDPRAGTSINIGLCREQLNQLASAWYAFKEALRRVKDPAKRKLAMDRMAAIEPRLSYVTISVADSGHAPRIALDGKRVDPGQLGVAMPIDGGRHTVEATAPGHEPWSMTVSVAGERGSRRVRVPALGSLGDALDRNRAPQQEQGETPAQTHSIFTPRRKLAVGIGVLGVGAAGGALAFGRAARILERDAFALCPDPQLSCARADSANNELTRARRNALFANIGLGLSGGLAATAIVLWATGAADEHEDNVAVVPYVGATSGVDVQVKF